MPRAQGAGGAVFCVQSLRASARTTPSAPSLGQAPAGAGQEQGQQQQQQGRGHMLTNIPGNMLGNILGNILGARTVVETRASRMSITTSSAA